VSERRRSPPEQLTKSSAITSYAGSSGVWRFAWAVNLSSEEWASIGNVFWGFKLNAILVFIVKKSRQ
jgi:hypothetical protein